MLSPCPVTSREHFPFDVLNLLLFGVSPTAPRATEPPHAAEIRFGLLWTNTALCVISTSHLMSIYSYSNSFFTVLPAFDFFFQFLFFFLFLEEEFNLMILDFFFYIVRMRFKAKNVLGWGGNLIWEKGLQGFLLKIQLLRNTKENCCKILLK